MTTTYLMCCCFLFLSARASGISNSFNYEDTLCSNECSCIRNEKIRVTCRGLNPSLISTSTVVMSVNEMDLSFNNTKRVKSDFFEGCNNLSTLIMSNSKIEKIDVNAFHSLKNLETIDLSKNMLTCIPNNLFIQNPKLKYLSLSRNPLLMLPNDGPILISSSLLQLHMKSCMISELSNISLSKLPYLQSLDLSHNGLKVLSADTFRPLSNLIDINLSKNHWTCNDDFEILVCLAYHKSNSHSQISCFTRNDSKKDYDLHDQHELCEKVSATKSSVRSNISTSKELDVATDMTIRTLVTLFQNISQEYTTGGQQEDARKRTNENDESFTISMSKQPSRPYNNKGPQNSQEGAGGTQSTVYRKRAVENEITDEAELRTAPKSETGGWASLLSWNVNTAMVFVILPLTLGVAVFVSLKAVNHMMKNRFHRPMHEIQGKDDSLAVFSPHIPLVNPQIAADLTKQRPVYVNRSSEYHVYEVID